jgi:hypothetical protein
MNPLSTDYPRNRKPTNAISRAKKLLLQRRSIVWAGLLLLCGVLVWQQVALREARQARANAQQAAGDSLYEQWRTARDLINRTLSAQDGSRPQDISLWLDSLSYSFDNIETLSQIYNTTLTGKFDDLNRLTMLFRVYSWDILGIHDRHRNGDTLLDAEEFATLQSIKHDLEQVYTIFDQASLAHLDQKTLDQKLERLAGAVESWDVQQVLR